MLEKSLGEVEELLPGLPETEQIVLLRTLANRLDELLYPPNRDACRIHIWGKRLEDLCRFLPSSPSVHSPHRALITRAQAMMGNLSTSRAYVNSIDKTEWDVHAGGTVILAVAFYRGLFQCLEFILRVTPYGHSHIENIIHILLSRTPNVLTVIPRAVEENWSFVQKRNLSCYLLSSTHDPKRLTDIITELQANNIPVTQNKILKTIHSLVATTKDVINAQKLYGSIPPSDEYRYIHAGIHLAGRTGNFKQAQAFFDKLKARGQVNKKHISDVLLSYAVGGHVREVFRLFDECFPKMMQDKDSIAPIIIIIQLPYLPTPEPMHETPGTETLMPSSLWWKICNVPGCNLTTLLLEARFGHVPSKPKTCKVFRTFFP